MKNKKFLIALLTMFIVFAQLMPAIATEQDSVWREFYVSPAGNDKNVGTKESPFKTIEQAQAAVSKISSVMQGDIVVNIMGGYHYLEDTLRFGVGDSGKNGYKVIYRGEKDNMPVVSGGIETGEFSRVSGHENLWQTKVSGVEYIRELYVNEKKAYMASSNGMVNGISHYKAEGSIYESDGMYMSKEDIGIYENPEDMEIKWAQGWVTTICGVDDLLQDPENLDQVIVKMEQSWWNYQVITGGTNGNGAKVDRDFVVYNAFELLDRPGEFYYNRKTEMLYYMPRAGEDMTKAKVIVPKLEKLIHINGNDVDDKVKNILFENIKFAHSTWLYPADVGFMNVQQQSMQGSFNYIPGAVTLNRTDSVEFENNYFFGIASSAVDMENATENTRIVGNAFSDIGNAAVVAGRGYHGDNDSSSWVGTDKNIPPEPAPSEFNLINGTETVTASYFGRDDTNNIRKYKGEQFWAADDEIFTGIITWRSDPEAIEKGEKSWIRFDFGNKYSLSKIILTFHKTDVKAEQKTGYELLLSNDKSFNEYVTVATQNTAAGIRQHYTDIPEGKYRYMMVRTLGATDFAISRVYAFTPDVELHTVAEINKFNTVSNNYIKRSDDFYYGGAAISGYYNHDYNITHNEIIDTSYSGIIQGWGWNREATGSYNNNISYNYIENATMMLGDGAGIYTLSHQPDTHISHNVVKNLFQGNGAYYPDEGSSYEEWHDNVADNVLTNIHVWTDSIRDNKMYNIYGTQDTVNINSPYNEIENIKVYPAGNPSPEAYAIMQEAGLEEKYEYLKDLVYDGEMNLPDERERYHDILTSVTLAERASSAANKMAQNILDYGSFGSLPGEYPYEYKEKLEKGIENLLGAGTSEKVERIIQLRRLVNEAADAVVHLSLPDMIELCENEIENATYSVSDNELKGTITVKVTDGKKINPVLDSYTATDLVEFANSVRFLKSEYEKGLTSSKEYGVLLKLEKAYAAFVRSGASADIEFINVENANRVEVDKENKTITAYFPYNADLSEVAVNIIPFADGELARVFNTVNLNSDIEIPIYSKKADDYGYWVLKAEHESEKETQTGWYCYIDNVQTEELTVDGKAYLCASKLPYIRKGKVSSGETEEISFKPISSYDVNDFIFYFGANSMEMEKNGKDINDNRFEIVVENKSATLKYRDFGMETEIAKFDFPINYNTYNKIAVKTTSKERGTLVEVWLNDNQVVNILTEIYLPDGGYVGLYSEKICFETNKY